MHLRSARLSRALAGSAALLLCGAVLAWSLPACSGGSSASGSSSSKKLPSDDLKDRSVHWNAHLVAPIGLSADGSRLYAINQGGQRLAIFDPATLQKLADIPCGPGLVSLAERPGASELWLADKVTSSVLVVDLVQLEIAHTIRVGAEPHGIAFTPAGDRAYVACSAVDRVDVIATATYSVAASIAVPARNPRAVAYAGGTAWVVPFLSGNNTAPMGAASTGPDIDRVVSVESLASFPGLNQLPDRDLFGIPSQGSPDLDHIDPALTVTGLGTLLFNVHARPGTSELWVPGTDALNAVHKGEVNMVGGQCVQNRIAIVDTTGAQPVRIVDLDAIAPAGTKCAQPTGVAFDPVRPRAYVCGYGSDVIAVLDLSGPLVAWAGAVDLPFEHDYPQLTSPRTCVVDATGQFLYVLNKGDTSISKVDLSALPVVPNFLVSAPVATPLGWDSVAGAERFGRNDLVDARNSKSHTTSCASCHADGHQDGLVWNLGKFLDPEGTPNDQLAFPLDDKGPMATQSVRRLFETGPYHWRGERAKLGMFNKAFIDLMEREENGVPKDLGAHFFYLNNYMRRVTYPANPRENLDRTLTPDQLAGAKLFIQKPVIGTATCATCHTLPLGTSGEIVGSHVRGVFAVADTPQLRGVGDKLSPPWFIGGAFGTRTELGAGLSHGGAFATIQELLLASNPFDPSNPVFDLTAQEADLIADFLEALDTGLAPATTYQATADASNAATFASTELAFLLAQARQGNCDVIFRRGPELFQGVQVWPSGLFDVATGRFRVAQAGAPEIDPQVLLQDAAAGEPLTFIGVPLWMGLPMALDRDLDTLLDLDEIVAGTDPENSDSDDDGFPDGYEVQWGMNPLVGGSSSPDGQAPALVGKPKLVYTTTNTIKFEIETDELTRVEVSVNGTLVQRLPLQNDYDSLFSIILNELAPGAQQAIALQLTDPAGNIDVVPLSYSTRALAFSPPTFVNGIALAVVPAGSGEELQATIELRAGDQPAQPGYQLVAAVYFQDATGALSTVISNAQAQLLASDGFTQFHVPLPAVGPSNPGKLHFVIRSVQGFPDKPLYARPLNVETWDSIDW